MALPPLLEGDVHERETRPFAPVAIKFVGCPGVVAGVTADELLL